MSVRTGSCLHPEDGLAALPTDLVDVVITDPPYSSHTHSKQRSGASLPDGRGEKPSDGVTRVGKPCIARTRDLGFDSMDPLTMRIVAQQLARITRRWVLIFCDFESLGDWKHELERAGLDWVRSGVWVKPGCTPQFSGDRPATGAEAIAMAHRPGAEGIAIAHRSGRKRWEGGGKHAVWTCPIVMNRSHKDPRLHTTQKPLALMGTLVQLFSEPGELVCDPFAGSGTTGVAATKLGRRFLGWEIDREAADMASWRIATSPESDLTLPDWEACLGGGDEPAVQANPA